MSFASAHHILLCLRYGIGDVVMELPVLDALRAEARQARLTVLGAAPAVELLQGDDRVDEVVSVSRWGLTHRWDDGTPQLRAELRRWFQDRAFDWIFDAHHAVIAIRNAAWTLGIRTVESDEAAEEAAVAVGKDGVAAIKEAVRAGWGLAVPENALPRLHLSEDERSDAVTRLEQWTGWGGEAPIGLSPVASLPMKRWPTDRFATVADRLTVETGRSILLFAGPQGDVAAEVLARLDHADRVLAIGAEPLRRTAALLACCAVFIGNDTGLTHMAAAAGTPVVGVYGPTAPEIYRPPSPRARSVVGNEIVCRYRNTHSLQPPGCWTSSHCLIAEHSCIRHVSVEAVLEAARAALAFEEGTVTRDRTGPRPRRGSAAA